MLSANLDVGAQTGQTNTEGLVRQSQRCTQSRNVRRRQRCGQGDKWCLGGPPTQRGELLELWAEGRFDDDHMRFIKNNGV